MVSFLTFTVRNRSQSAFLELRMGRLPLLHSWASPAKTHVLILHLGIRIMAIIAQNLQFIENFHVKLAAHFQISQSVSLRHCLQKTSAEFHVPQEFDELGSE